MIISKVYERGSTMLRDGTLVETIGKEVPNQLTLQSDKETVLKAAELINLFSQIPLENIKASLGTTEGQLAIAVLSCCVKENETKELTPMRMLVDELAEKLSAVDSNRDYISREALMIELNDVLKAKTITPYRRQRINRAFKRECLHCLGTGKVGKVISDTQKMYEPRKIKVGISNLDPECPTCNGTGIKPKKKEQGIELMGEEYTNKTEYPPPGGISIK